MCLYITSSSAPSKEHRHSLKDMQICDLREALLALLAFLAAALAGRRGEALINMAMENSLQAVGIESSPMESSPDTRAHQESPSTMQKGMVNDAAAEECGDRES
ncbi:hypothetical protein DNTS_024541 [Danionella cerebrum]|uniref:Uncharacterized protein n=1 Tax=Danionella cerebrum TaxID=2873325 RepID=A0A553R7F0_9TELE|nr:hypothetical protein DNTS_024541 [Danionella translucida]